MIIPSRTREPPRRDEPGGARADRGPAARWYRAQVSEQAAAGRLDPGQGPPSDPQAHGGDIVIELTSYHAVREALREDGALTTRDLLDLGQRRPVLPLQSDGEEHGRIRGVLEPIFAPAEVAAREATLRDHVGRLLDPFAPGTTVDLNAVLSRWLPVLALTDLLDLPAEDAPLLRSFHDRILDPTADESIDRQSVGDEIYAYFEPVVAARRGEEGPDLIRRAQAAPTGGAGLSADEIVDCCYLLLLAGIDPVAKALATSIALLADQPSRRDELVGDPAQMRRTIEEVLRWGGAVDDLARLATSDTTIGGHLVPRGARVVCSVRGANRDPSAFPEPDRFDADRATRAHLSFGIGAHRCIGAHLARLELRVAIEELHRRHPHHRMAPEGRSIDASRISATSELPVDLGQERTEP